MQINSFFCGAGGFDLGFIQAGYTINKAWDFDKYAVESYAANIGKHVEQKDIREMVGADVPYSDGWLFGFPCQDLSRSGKMVGLHEGKRSGLFFEVMRLLGEVEHKPKFILAENVKGLMPYIDDVRNEYSKAGYEMHYVLYDSKYHDVAQTRERYFILGINKSTDSSTINNFKFSTENKVVTKHLIDVLLPQVDAKYYVDPTKTKGIMERFEARNYSEPVMEDIDRIGGMWGNKQAGRCYGKNGVSPTLKTSSGGYSQPLVILDAKCFALRGRKNAEGKYIQRPEYNGNTTTNTLTSVQKDNYVDCLEQREETTEWAVRRLTPKEYAILQGFPHDYKQVVSDTQFYKQMGNAVTVNVAKFVAEQIKGIDF